MSQKVKRMIRGFFVFVPKIATKYLNTSRLSIQASLKRSDFRYGFVSLLRTGYFPFRPFGLCVAALWTGKSLPSVHCSKSLLPLGFSACGRGNSVISKQGDFAFPFTPSEAG